jgi:glycosyltransferase involved in cell wall biosynthesis
MNILMITNTYKPHVGGVANSVYTFKESLQNRGNQLLVVSPHFDDEAQEDDVIRVNAIKNFNSSDFSVSLPTPTLISDIHKHFIPDIVHSHHPFQLGNSALRVSSLDNVPIVFTHHTLYERYTHYIPGDSEILRDLAIKLSTEYANLCSCVIAPSHAIKELLLSRGVKKDIEVIPTGIDVQSYKNTPYDEKLASEFGIDKDDFVIGHVSRLANEKNQHFLCRCVGKFLQKHKNCKFLLVGDGEIKEELADIFKDYDVSSQVVFCGVETGVRLKKLYKLMDIFSFTSTSETQGMVLAEALSASTPVVALEASGVSEMIVNNENGTLIKKENEQEFIDAYEFYYQSDSLDEFKKNAIESADKYSIQNTTDKLEKLYQKLISQKNSLGYKKQDLDIFEQSLNAFNMEYKIWKSKINSVLKVSS